MGRRRFRLADMMPNSWFYKLRDMRRARGHGHLPGSGGAATAMLPSSSPPPPPPRRSATKSASPRRGSVAALPHRTSYYYPTGDRVLIPPPPLMASPAATEDDRDRELLPEPESPPTTYCSSTRRHRVGVGPVRAGRGLEAVAEARVRDAPRRRRDMYVAGCDGSEDEEGLEDSIGDVRSRPEENAPSEYSPGGGGGGAGKVIASETDIVIDLRGECAAERVLRPIVTRPARREAVRYEQLMKDAAHADAGGGETTPRVSSAAASEHGGRGRRPSVSAGRRLRTRVNSPRLASARSRKSSSRPPPTTPAASPRKMSTLSAPPPPLAESFAVVKASADPRRDFRESMEEMIAEKGIRGAADLEDLLACYLALNAAEHHDLIVEVFEQIWASLAGAANHP
ncbi:unnamed protein product [Urochloa humidicola]